MDLGFLIFSLKFFIVLKEYFIESLFFEGFNIYKCKNYFLGFRVLRLA